jgi:hypothetical protein
MKSTGNAEYMQAFLNRLHILAERIKQACAAAGRDPREVTLMAVSKGHGPEAVLAALRAGLCHIGENRVQEAAAKRPLVPLPARWELIGHLQRNKARQAVCLFDRIQSVDRPELVTALARLCAEAERAELPVLLQVNAGADPNKFGADADGAAALLDAALAAPALRVEGLMTIAPFADDPDVALHCFGNLRAIRDRLAAATGTPLPVLSMGMTQDLEAAIRMGSTMVRIGTALFGER